MRLRLYSNHRTGAGTYPAVDRLKDAIRRFALCCRSVELWKCMVVWNGQLEPSTRTQAFLYRLNLAHKMLSQLFSACGIASLDLQFYSNCSFFELSCSYDPFTFRHQIIFGSPCWLLLIFPPLNLHKPRHIAVFASLRKWARLKDWEHSYCTSNSCGDTWSQDIVTAVAAIWNSGTRQKCGFGWF